MNASVIIVNWNGKDLLDECMPSVVEAVKQCRGKHEIIVVDNGSTGGSIEFIKLRFPSVKVVALNENMGFQIASNIGAKKAKTDELKIGAEQMSEELNKKVETMILLGKFKSNNFFSS